MNKVLKTLLPIIWAGFIFFLSHKPKDFYPEESFNWGPLAHVILYAVLAYLLLLAIYNWRKDLNFKKLFLFVFLVSIFYGITDEYHQSFIVGREPSSQDVFYDAFGSLFGVLFFYLLYYKRKPRLLLQVCCIGCGAYVVESLKEDYNITLYFYNPNIFPEGEYEKRLEESKRIAKKLKLKLVEGEYNHGGWLDKIKEYEKEPERGERCLICYRDRLSETARQANKKKFDYFSTTLTISPHKDAGAISKIGQELSKKYNIKYLDRDFKKQDGFKKTCALSKELGLYRQDYCGCEFSYKKKN